MDKKIKQGEFKPSQNKLSIYNKVEEQEISKFYTSFSYSFKPQNSSTINIDESKSDSWDSIPEELSDDQNPNKNAANLKSKANRQRDGFENN